MTRLSRIKWKKAWNEEGVAATVGTILSLMVFLTFLGMFTNQYVPIWMKDNENKHMNQVISQFSGIKSGIDMQTLSANAMGASAPIYSPIQLHADGVPIFASPTMGELQFSGDRGTAGPCMYLSYEFSDGTLDEDSGALAGGSLAFYGPNRYFVQQSVVFENGAIILNQSAGETVLAGISLRISTDSDAHNTILITLTSLIGDDKTIGGFGSKSVTTMLDFASNIKVDNTNPKDLTITTFTQHGIAWKNYFTSALGSSGEVDPLGPPTLINEVNYFTVTATIHEVVSLELTKAVASVVIGDVGV